MTLPQSEAPACMQAAAEKAIELIRAGKPDADRMRLLAAQCRIQPVAPGRMNAITFHTTDGQHSEAATIYGRAVMLHPFPRLMNGALCRFAPIIALPLREDGQIDASLLIHETMHLLSEGEWKRDAHHAIFHKSGARRFRGKWEGNGLCFSEVGDNTQINELLTHHAAQILLPQLGLGEYRHTGSESSALLHERIEQCKDALGMSEHQLMAAYFIDSRAALFALEGVDFFPVSRQHE